MPGTQAPSCAAWAGRSSSIHLPEHDVERAEDGGDVGEHVAFAEEVHRLQMRETGRPDLALVGLVGAVRDEIDAKLALRRLDRGIDFAGGHMEAFGVELEMMDQRLHRALHLGALWWNDLVVVDGDRPLPFWPAQLGDALLHDVRRLAHLLHADAVAIIAIAVLADRDVEIELGIALVRLRLAQ